jgi:hypothetical protein
VLMVAMMLPSCCPPWRYRRALGKGDIRLDRLTVLLGISLRLFVSGFVAAF